MEAGSQSEFFELLTNFFKSGTYPDFRDSVEAYLERIGDDFDWIAEEIEEFTDSLDVNLELFGEHIDSVAEGTADFEFSFTIIGSEYEDTSFVFSRHFFNMLDTLGSIGENMGDSFEDGFDWMDSVMDEPGGNVMPGVAFIRQGLSYFDELLDTIQVILVDQPFAPLEIDVSGIDSLQEVVAEVDTLLGGKEYDFGLEEEGKIIKPLAILQKMPDNGLWTLYEDFYRDASPVTYTFGGIFPQGITGDMLEMILPDVVFNTWDDEDALDAHIAALKAGWLALDPIEPDDHFGIALCLIYELLTDEELFDNFEQAFEYMSDGRIDSLIFHHDWDSFDRHDEIAEIRYHLDEYIESEGPTNFVVLIKEEEDPSGPYEIGEDTEFSITHITVPHVAIVTHSLSIFADGLTLIQKGLTEVYNELGDIFVIDLDPTFLNFSEVESDSDLILLLEASNPDFLSVTPYGIEKFHEAGDWLEQAFQKLYTFFDQMTALADAILPYEEDFDIDGEEFFNNMEETADIMQKIWKDFAFPDSTVTIDGERVNLSALFDNPPASFLMIWKDFVFGIDSSLGGLFPDRMLAIGQGSTPFLPEELSLYPTYPNPFNPVARIEFDLPMSADIRLFIVNLKGEEIELLINGRVKSGKNVVLWNAKNYPSGIYFSVLQADGRFFVRKMTLLK